MECTTNKLGYFIAALIWNNTILSVIILLVSWPLDILGSVINSEIIRGYAYGFAIVATICTFWFGILSAIFSSLVKCKKCGSRILKFRSTFLVSLINCKCNNCGKENA